METPTDGPGAGECEMPGVGTVGRSLRWTLAPTEVPGASERLGCATGSLSAKMIINDHRGRQELGSHTAAAGAIERPK